MISGTTWTIGGPKMRKVTLGVSSRNEINQRFRKAFGGESQGEFISFESPTLLFKVLTGKRWELLDMMTGTGAMSIREAARRLGRDVKNVHSDVKALLNAGLLQKNENGGIEFPYDIIQVNFTLKAA
jgi:predicted transcriptional regulator